MNKALYIIAALMTLVGLMYVVAKLIRTIRRVGFTRFARGLGTLFVSLVATGLKLVVGGAGKPSASRPKPLDLSGTGGRYNARTGNYDNGQDPYGIYPDDDRHF